MSSERTICDFITQFNLLFRINDDLLLTTNRDDFGSTVRVTRMIDKPTVQGQHQKVVVRIISDKIVTILTLDCLSWSHPPPNLHQFEKDNYCRCLDVHRLSRACPRLAHE